MFFRPVAGLLAGFIGNILCSGSEFNRRTDTLFQRTFINSLRGHDIQNSAAGRLKDRDLIFGSPPRYFPGNDLTKFTGQALRFEAPVLNRNDQVAGFIQNPVAGIDINLICVCDAVFVDFMHLGGIGTDTVDVAALFQYFWDRQKRSSRLMRLPLQRILACTGFTLGALEDLY